MDLQKRKKNYFSNNGNQKRRRNLTIEVGMTGFLCTCNFREKDCVRDAYKLLNEFADNLYGSDNYQKNKDDINKEDTTDEIDKEQESDTEDISTTLNREIEQLKAESERPIALRRFQVVDTGVKNVIFIKSNLPNPLELVTNIVQELNDTKQQRSRYLLRLLPIETICKAYMNDIKSKASVLFEKYFAQEPRTFSIVFNRHSNNNIRRNEIIEDLAEIVIKANPGNKADLKNPEIAIVVEVIRGLCLISIAPYYFKFKKYNLLEICNTKKDKLNDKDGITKDVEKKEQDTCDEVSSTLSEIEEEQLKLNTDTNLSEK